MLTSILDFQKCQTPALCAIFLFEILQMLPKDDDFVKFYTNLHKSIARKRNLW